MTDAARCDTDASLYDVFRQPIIIILFLDRRTTKCTDGGYVFVSVLCSCSFSNRVNTTYMYIPRASRWPIRGNTTSIPEAAPTSEFSLVVGLRLPHRLRLRLRLLLLSHPQQKRPISVHLQTRQQRWLLHRIILDLLASRVAPHSLQRPDLRSVCPVVHQPL